MNGLNLKSVLTTGCFALGVCFGACHSANNTTDTWDSTRKHTMPADSTINKIDTSASSPLTDTVMMMTDTSNR